MPKEAIKQISRYHLVTFGCQMNKYDSEKIEGILAGSGMKPVSEPENADIILVNTCSIREKAENKVFSFIGRLAEHKKGNRNLLLALGGCMATLRREEIFKYAPSLDLVFGPDSLDKLPEMIHNRLNGGKRQLEVEFRSDTAWDGPESNVRPSPVSAWIGIMKGCDNHCSYCVVPSTRGPEVSRPVESIIKEAEELAVKGYKEINLLGQNVNSFGKTLKGDADFPGLLSLLEKVDGVERIRFMTSHPKDLNDRLIKAMASSDKICPSFHLPLQAGSNRILEMMNRGYRAEEYLEKVNRLKEAVPGIFISTDLMVGFPSETEEEFEETIRMMEEVRFDSIFLFIYSPRPGTPAEELKNRIPREVTKRRFDKAYALHKRITAEKNLEIIGRKVVALCEGQYNEGGGNVASGGAKRQFGRTPGGHIVIFSADNELMGKNVRLKITGSQGFSFLGEPCN